VAVNRLRRSVYRHQRIVIIGEPSLMQGELLICRATKMVTSLQKLPIGHRVCQDIKVCEHVIPLLSEGYQSWANGFYEAQGLLNWDKCLLNVNPTLADYDFNTESEIQKINRCTAWVMMKKTVTGYSYLIDVVLNASTMDFNKAFQLIYVEFNRKTLGNIERKIHQLTRVIREKDYKGVQQFGADIARRSIEIQEVGGGVIGMMQQVAIFMRGLRPEFKSFVQ
jgi:hypothetical protein